MMSHWLHGSWDQVKGFGLELWGEVLSDADMCATGQRERLLGQLETRQNMSRQAAEQTLHETLH